MPRSFETLNTFGDPAIDEQIRRMLKRISDLEEAKTAVTSPEPPRPTAPPVFAGGEIEVKESDGDPDLLVAGIEFDQADGFAVSSSGALAKVNLTTPPNPLLDGSVHNDTVAQSPTKGSIVAANSTPKWDEFVVGSNDQVIVADSAQTLGIKYQTRIKSLAKNGSAALTGDVTLTGGSGVTLTQAGQDISIAASGGAGATTPVWRCREYHAAIGADLYVDGSWFFTPGVTNPGGNRPSVKQRQRPRYASDPNGSFEFGLHQHLLVLWARISIVVTGSPSFDWWVPNVDNNFGIYREALANGTGQAKMTGVGTATAFSSGSGNDLANVGDMLMSQGSDNIGEPLYISAVNTDTSLTIPNSAFSGSGTTVFRNYRFLRKVYRAKNQVAQTPVDQSGTESLTAGTHTYHIFANNDGLQAAFNWVVNMLSVAGITYLDPGAETWDIG